MSIAPALCPQCLAAGQIATANGPTCQHAGGWFPADWATMGEAARLAWIERQKKQLS